ncbi:hypothetical protein FIBSPDRAFT_955306 [Athelia psychrophila]|uniref:Retrotransposon Copia-like N-terminal domain-containing protein n=1 Tax=Athelia psychrophila TaxID=1759441 RepID=A0A166IBV3_9AGAM|nr:hypothetical protein FIBSPDRAFT_955306 [Fibularhizoctonia sp. CBS 109695]
MGSQGTAANVPPANPAGGTLTPSASTNPFNSLNLCITPIKEISISAAMINSLANNPKFKPLEMAIDNYSVWERSMKDVLELNFVYKYVTGAIPLPAYDITAGAENTLYWAYMANNVKIIAFLNVNIEELEKLFIEGMENAHNTWTTLKTRHQGRGPVVQMNLMQEAGRVSFGPDPADLPAAIHHAKDLVSHIYAPGFPSQDTFFLVTMFQGLAASHPVICSDARTYYTSNPTAGPQWLLDCVSQEVVWRAKGALPDVALAATGGGGGRPVCTVPSCKRPGHTKATCWQVGGDMHGWEAEQREIIAKRHKVNGGGSRGGRGGKSGGRGGKSNNNPFRQATNGRAYLIDAVTNEAVFISNSNASEPTANILSPAIANSATALMALQTNPFPDAWALSAEL